MKWALVMCIAALVLPLTQQNDKVIANANGQRLCFRSRVERSVRMDSVIPLKWAGMQMLHSTLMKSRNFLDRNERFELCDASRKNYKHRFPYFQLTIFVFIFSN